MKYYDENKFFLCEIIIYVEFFYLLAFINPPDESNKGLQYGKDKWESKFSRN